MGPEETTRLAHLRALGQLPHTEPSAALDAIVVLAAEVCGTPIALVTLVEEFEQHFKAQVGIERRGTPRDISFCTHAIEHAAFFEVPDASKVELFADNPLVTGPDNIRFYAGAPMTLSSGHRIGTVCVLDKQQRSLSDQQRVMLTQLAQVCVSIFEDAAENRLSKLWAYRTLEAVADAVIAVDGTGTISYVNELGKQLLATAQRGEESSDADVFAIFDLDGNHVTPIADCLATALPQTHADGRLLATSCWERHEVEYSVTPVVDDIEGSTGAVMILRDVSRERDLERRAHTDTLTGAHSRYAFETRLTAHLDVTGVPGGAVFLFDLDRFKGVNDSLGHGVGDSFLLALSTRVASLVNGDQVFARIGGDEFAIFLPRAVPATIELLGDALLHEIDRFCSTFTDARAAVSASIGVAMLNEANLSVGEVLRRADAGCYHAKRDGGARLRVFSRSDQLIDLSTGKAGWLSITQAALDNGDLVLFGQRLRSINASQRDSIEVLLRLVHEGVIVSARDFFPPVECSLLASTVDEWVVQQTVDLLGGASAALCTFDLVHINLSARTIGDNAAVSRIAAIVESSPVPGDKLCFEITETTAITDLAAAHRSVTTLRSLGAKIALDDFGQGFASFGQLKEFPFDIVKIDSMFVSDLSTDPVSGHMVAAIQGVCDHLNIKTVAEGVETIETVDELVALGVHSAQGYLFDHPAPLTTLLNATARPSVPRQQPGDRADSPSPGVSRLMSPLLFASNAQR